MADFEYRNQPFDYTPPARSGNAGGAIWFVLGIIALFILAMVFFGGGQGTVAPDVDAPVAAPAAVPTLD